MTNIDKAVEIIKQGGIVIFPTDTAFGIGCSINNEESVNRLFEIRKRPSKKAMPVLFNSIGQVKDYLLPFGSGIGNLMDKYWPGALTIILECDIDKIPNLVRGGGNTLGVRVPDHETILRLIEGVGLPIIGTSANFSGEKTPFTLSGLDKRLVKLVDFVLEGETKGRRCASTVLDCTRSPWEIVRQGDIRPDL